MPLADISEVPNKKRFLSRGVPIPPSSLSKSNGGFRPFSSLAKLSFSTPLALLPEGSTSAEPTSPARKTRMLATKPLSLRKQDKSLENDFTKRSVADADRANNSIPPDNEAEEKWSYHVRVRSFRRAVGEVCGNTSSSVLARGKRESERKGNPPVNTGPSQNSDNRANNTVEEVNEPARRSGLLQKMKA
ncbi:hypothetical protein T01_9405 [Trichinella spiralis]|uniref:Uncharacterized protein n=1 Tax=Trichinella spiralis TaxID=6334 RepID=A0A0V1BZY4_TRISP|nr:hypothetical protein T01_9405 [Trichinella spiralis]